jgi:hypothetical protein
MDIFNKEDSILSNDIEVYENNFIESNLDTPLENYILHFPNCKNPHEKVEHLYRTFFSSYIDNHATISLDEGRELVAKKARLTPLALDAAINTIIQQEFQCELELDYGMSMEVITSLTPNELLDKTKTTKEFKLIKRNPNELFDNTLLKNRLYVATDGKNQYRNNGTRKHYVFKSDETIES